MDKHCSKEFSKAFQVPCETLKNLKPSKNNDEKGCMINQALIQAE